MLWVFTRLFQECFENIIILISLLSLLDWLLKRRIVTTFQVTTWCVMDRWHGRGHRLRNTWQWPLLQMRCWVRQDFDWTKMAIQMFSRQFENGKLIKNYFMFSVLSICYSYWLVKFLFHHSWSFSQEIFKWLSKSNFTLNWLCRKKNRLPGRMPSFTSIAQHPDSSVGPTCKKCGITEMNNWDAEFISQSKIFGLLEKEKKKKKELAWE